MRNRELCAKLRDNFSYVQKNFLSYFVLVSLSLSPLCSLFCRILSSAGFLRNPSSLYLISLYNLISVSLIFCCSLWLYVLRVHTLSQVLTLSMYWYVCFPSPQIHGENPFLHYVLYFTRLFQIQNIKTDFLQTFAAPQKPLQVIFGGIIQRSSFQLSCSLSKCCLSEQ